MWKTVIAGVTACTWLLLSGAALAQDLEYEIIGEAYHADDLDRLLYEERYTPVDDNGKGEVHYLDPDGERIAEKTLDYSPGKNRPSFELTDLRQDLQWSASWSDDEQQIRLTRGSQDAPEAKTVQAEQRQVIDAGFDPFIQSQWETLMDGERVTFHFAFPNQLTNVRLRAERIDASDSPIQKQQERWAYFQIRVNSVVLSLFADNLYLAYDPDEKRLMVFRGRSNIPDAEGDGWDVEIHYRYP